MTTYSASTQYPTVPPSRRARGRRSASTRTALMLRHAGRSPNYFGKVKLSAVALMKMASQVPAIHELIRAGDACWERRDAGGDGHHARQDRRQHVCGDGRLSAASPGCGTCCCPAAATMFAGTETRVSAHEQADQYMIDYIESAKKVAPHCLVRHSLGQVGRLEDAVGWYHSHPGYGCWLSGIDVTTQRINQMGQDPFLAVVVCSVRAQRSLKCFCRLTPRAPCPLARSSSAPSAHTPRCVELPNSARSHWR